MGLFVRFPPCSEYLKLGRGLAIRISITQRIGYYVSHCTQGSAAPPVEYFFSRPHGRGSFLGGPASPPPHNWLDMVLTLQLPVSFLNPSASFFLQTCEEGRAGGAEVPQKALYPETRAAPCGRPRPTPTSLILHFGLLLTHFQRKPVRLLKH